MTLRFKATKKRLRQLRMDFFKDEIIPLTVKKGKDEVQFDTDEEPR